MKVGGGVPKLTPVEVRGYDCRVFLIIGRYAKGFLNQIRLLQGIDRWHGGGSGAATNSSCS